MTRRDRLMGLAILGLILLAGFWFGLLAPARKAATDAKGQVATAQTALEAAQAKVTSGKAAQAAYRRDRATIVKIGKVVPETDDIPTLITQLETLAHKYDVYFLSYDVTASPGGGSTGSSSASSSSSSGAAPSAAAGTSSAASTSTTAQPGAKGTNSSTNAVAPLYPPGSIEMTGGLGRTPITLGLRGTYFNLEKYLRAVQRFAVLSAKNERTDGRLMIVDGFDYKPGDLVFASDGKRVLATKRYLEATLGASVYFAPPLETPSASSAAAATPGAATPASSATPANTSTGTAAVGGLR